MYQAKALGRNNFNFSGRCEPAHYGLMDEPPLEYAAGGTAPRIGQVILAIKSDDTRQDAEYAWPVRSVYPSSSLSHCMHPSTARADWVTPFGKPKS